MEHRRLTEENVVRLRPMEPADAVELASWGQDAQFCRAAGWSEGVPEADLVEFWAGVIASPPPDLRRLTATLDGAVVGYVDLHGPDPEVLELGYLIGPAARWGRGLGTAAARLGLRYGFTVLDLERVWAESPASNAASVRVLQRLGMRDAGTGGPTTYCGEPTEYQRFSITRAQWQATLERTPGRTL